MSNQSLLAILAKTKITRAYLGATTAQVHIGEETAIGQAIHATRSIMIDVLYVEPYAASDLEELKRVLGEAGIFTEDKGSLSLRIKTASIVKLFELTGLSWEHIPQSGNHKEPNINTTLQEKWQSGLRTAFARLPHRAVISLIEDDGGLKIEIKLSDLTRNATALYGNLGEVLGEITSSEIDFSTIKTEATSNGAYSNLSATFPAEHLHPLRIRALLMAAATPANSVGGVSSGTMASGPRTEGQTPPR